MTIHLNAPWRSKYLRGPREKGCVFCRIATENKDKENYLLYRGKKNYVVLNRFPYTSGHLLVIPFRHISTFEKIPQDTMMEIMELTKQCVANLKKEFHCQGINLGMNLGRCAGAGIVGHLHMHIVPRWTGDASFMTTTGETRISSISMEEVFESLAGYYK